MLQLSNSELSQDVVFDLLSNPRRRYVLYYLREEESEVKLQDLAREVAAWEFETPVDDLTKGQQKRVYVSLYQTHIPKLAEYGVIDYDEDTGMIELSDRASDLRPYLGEEQRQVPWQLYYVGVTLVGALFFLLVSFDVPPFDGVPEFAAGLLVIAAFGVLAAAHLLVTRYDVSFQ